MQPDPLDIAMVILVRQYLLHDFYSDLFFQYVLKNPEDVINVYLYVANNPINWIDPHGLFKWKTFGYGIFEVSIGIGSAGFAYTMMVSTGGIAAVAGIMVFYEGAFVFGAGLADIIGAFYDEDPLVSQLPKKIDFFGRKVPFSPLWYPLPPDVPQKENGRPCEKKD